MGNAPRESSRDATVPAADPVPHGGSLIPRTLLSVPIFLKVLGMALGLIVLLGAGMMWQIHQTWHGMLRRHLEIRGQFLGRDLARHAAEHLPARNRPDLDRLLAEMKERSPDIAYLLVLDPRGGIVASAPAVSAVSEAPAGRGGGADVSVIEAPGGAVRDVTVPILGGIAGTVRVGMSERRLDYEVGWLASRLIAVTGTIAALGLASAWILAGAIARPILRLRDAARAVKEGDYRVRAPGGTTDEVGELGDAFNEMTAALQRKEAIRQELLRRVIGAAEEERRRIARELHDQTGQALTSIILGLGALESSAADPAEARRLNELRSVAEGTLGEVHGISSALRPRSLDDVGLLPALRRHCRTFGDASRVAVECQAVDLRDERLPDLVEVTVYRIVQEALANAVRHGRAGRVHVMLQRHDSVLRVVVEDDGIGFDASDWRARCLRGDRLGLLGIEERASLLGGSLRVESRPAAGTSLFVEIPLPEGKPCGESAS